jgi:hypothetical protein
MRLNFSLWAIVRSRATGVELGNRTGFAIEALTNCALAGCRG